MNNLTKHNISKFDMHTIWKKVPLAYNWLALNRNLSICVHTHKPFIDEEYGLWSPFNPHTDEITEAYYVREIKPETIQEDFILTKFKTIPWKVSLTERNIWNTWVSKKTDKEEDIYIIKSLKNVLTKEEYKGYILGNIYKYRFRKDIKKALEYEGLMDEIIRDYKE